jgi:membrane fusion protein (multidrug efflux system)
VIATESAIEENTRSPAIRSVVTSTTSSWYRGIRQSEDEPGKDERALMIPTQAVLPQGRQKQVITYRGGKAVFSDIATGIRDSANIQVTSGLNIGDTVITTGLLFLRPGAEVKLSKIQ